jgi:phage gp29-like protein
MLKETISLLTSAFTSDAPSTSSTKSTLSTRTAAGVLAKPPPMAHLTAMAALHQRQSQLGNLDVDYVAGAISSAQSGNITDLLALYRDIEAADTTIQGAINTRKLAVVARGYNVVPAPNTGAEGERVADEVKAMLERSDTFIDACTWLLHGCIWPVSVCNMRWVPGGPTGGYSHPEFRNVPLELFDYTTRQLRIKDVDDCGTPLTTTHYPVDERYIVHRGHMLMAPDIWGGPMRALVFWFLFSTQDREWWARFLERFGAPFLLGTYDKNDEDSRLNLERAFSEATRLFGIVATRETQVTIQDAGSQSNASAAFQMFHECAKKEKLLLICGQTLSSNAEGTGLGSGVANLQGEVREDVKLWDAFKLSKTVEKRVIAPWMRMNGIKGPTPQLTFGGFNPSALAGMAAFLEAVPKAGLKLADDSITVISRHVGIELERADPPPAPVIAPPGAEMPKLGKPGEPKDVAAALLMLAASGLPPSTVANEAIASDAAAEYSRDLSLELAPLAQIVASSRSTGELLQRAGAFMAGYRSGRASEILEACLVAHSTNAAVSAVTS